METLTDLFSTQGRANRAWYFWHIILDDLAMFTAIILFVVMGTMFGMPLLILPAIGVGVAGVWAGICITVKRFHDLGRPGWHWLFLLIPLVNIYFGFLLLFQKGTDGPNEFGADPLAAAKAFQP